MDAVMFGLAGAMYGAKPVAPIQIAWPQLQPYYTNLDKAKQLAEAGNLNGFEATGSRNPNEAHPASWAPFVVVDERSSAEVPAAPFITSAIPVTFRLQRSPKATKPLMMRRLLAIAGIFR